MTTGNGYSVRLLFAGDLAAFVISLWLALYLRAGAVPSSKLFLDNLAPFLVLFFLWLLVFYAAGLYSKDVTLMRSRLQSALVRTQLFNITLAALFFFFIPYFGVTPKTILLIYLAVSLFVVFLWRLALFPRLSAPAAREHAALIGSGPEVDELLGEVNGNRHYPLYIAFTEDPRALTVKTFAAFAERLRRENISRIVVDGQHEAVRPVQPHLYELVFARGCRFLEFHRLYEEVFDRVPLSLLRYEWFLEHLTRDVSGLYLFVKRGIDIVGALVMGAVVLVLIVPLWLAMKLEDGGELFIVQERLGFTESRIRCLKFRSMRVNKTASKEWTVEEKKDNPVTRVGSFLRLTSLDEFPQCINVLRGELSLVGPRNDIAGLGERLAQEIPYYRLRYSVVPGITGWAQINQRYEPGQISPQSVEETKIRLAYDFYYIEHRSLTLDFVIMLRTVKRMLFRVSRW